MANFTERRPTFSEAPISLRRIVASFNIDSAGETRIIETIQQETNETRGQSKDLRTKGVSPLSRQK